MNGTTYLNIVFFAVALVGASSMAAVEEVDLGPMVDPQAISLIAISPNCRSAGVVQRADPQRDQLLLNGQKYFVATQRITAVALSTDGKQAAAIWRVVSALPDQRPRLDVGYTRTAHDEFVEAPGGMVFSPDGKHFAYIAKEAGSWFAYVDSQAGPPSDLPVTELSFSPESSYLAYVVQSHGKKRVVAHGSQSEAYLDVREVKFSADGNHLAYAAQIAANQWVVVIDGKKGKAYLDVDDILMSRHGTTVVYIAKLSDDPNVPDHVVVVENGEEGALFYRITAGPVLSDDGSHCLYTADKGIAIVTTNPATRYPTSYPKLTSPVSTAPIAVLDGKVTDMLFNYLQDATYSPDGKRFAFINRQEAFPAASLGGGPHLLYDTFVVDENRFDLRGTEMGGIVFSPDGKHVACAVRPYDGNYPPKDYRWLMFVDGQTGPLYDKVGPAIFSADSKHMGYAALKQNAWIMVLDGKELSQYELLRPTFDGKTDAPWNSVLTRHIRVSAAAGNAGNSAASVPLPYCFDSAGRLNFIGLRDGKLFQVSEGE